MTTTSRDLSDPSQVQELRTWIAASPGKLVAAVERQILDRLLPDLFGYHIVELGTHFGETLLGSSRISHKIHLDFQHRSQGPCSLVGRVESLPLDGASIDVLVIPHLLEFSSDPHAVLREAERVLIGEGHLVIIGFNPWSMFGVWGMLWRWQGVPPWGGRFLSASRAKDWLKLLGFDVTVTHKASFRPPLKSDRLNERLSFLEKLGGYCWPIFGNVYVIVAKKRVLARTPPRLIWKNRRRLVSGGVVEPTVRAPNNAVHYDEP
ncbi:MAG: methyltransferase domain-containing protein [Pseudomonadota bacterium]